MRIAIVHIQTILKAGRLDTDIYMGDGAERALVRARENLRRARVRLKNAKNALRARNAERRRLGIRVSGVPVSKL